jgi:peptide deformylase
MLELTHYPNPILRKVCREVTTEEISSGMINGMMIEEITSFMFDCMKKHDGCGLAAPQANLDVRLFVAEHEGRRYVCINPVLSKMREKFDVKYEGCLSIPHAKGLVNRYRYVTLTATEPNGQQMIVKADNWLARIFQHETDHLDGKLFIDTTAVADLDACKSVLDDLKQKWEAKQQNG